MNDHSVNASPTDVVTFWRDAGPRQWFAKNADFDAAFAAKFMAAHEAAAQGAIDHWAETAEGALALILLLDQFPRNVFRDTPRMFATDAKGRAVADAAIARGFDRAMGDDLAVFFYLPFEHSESLEDQERAVALCARLSEEYAKYAVIHRDVIARFGRFPHRNAILGRESTAEEVAFLAEGGFAG